MAVIGQDQAERLAAIRDGLGPVEVAWSEHDGTFRASLRGVEAKRGGLLRSLASFGSPTPDGAVEGLWALVTDPAVLLVRDAYAVSGPRVEMRYDPESGTWPVAEGAFPRAARS